MTVHRYHPKYVSVGWERFWPGSRAAARLRDGYCWAATTDGVNGFGVPPVSKPGGAEPAVGEHVAFAVRSLEDFSVPIIVLERNLRVLQPIARVAREHARHAPRLGSDWAGGGRRLEVADEGLCRSGAW